jgi:transcriptional regulator with XRE-family HTH domain
VTDLGRLAAARLQRRVRQLREERGLSQGMLAEACMQDGMTSLTRIAINKVELGKRNLKAEEAATLARVLGVSPEYLLETAALEDMDAALGRPSSEPGASASEPGASASAESAHPLSSGGDPAIRPGGDPATRPRRSGVFRDRRDELERVLRGLASSSGPHFWLVVAPPQLGKTWLLRQVSAEVAAAEPHQWVTRLVDLRQQPPAVRGDVEALVSALFGRESPITSEPESLRSIALEIIRSGRPHLCLLDGAELLEEQTISTLRWCLSEIYHLIHSAGNTRVRLALIAASRWDDKWRGVTPDPRLSLLPLDEFKVGVVQDALHDLAGQMGRVYSDAEIRQKAVLVHHVTEGLPALLAPFLEWIRDEEWLDVERLEDQQVFEERAGSYIHAGLLSQASLLPWKEGDADKPLHALGETFRILAPYRLFTQSHLRHHLVSDPRFQRIVDDAEWSLADLWTAVSGTALLRRPLDEPWQEIHAAVRRLLYHYYYKSDEQRAEAQHEARKFIEAWADRQSGKEQVVGLVECLWHEAAALRISRSAEITEALIESARKLSQALRASAAYTVTELRAYAAERMSNDEEFQESVGQVAGLANRLAEIIVRPGEES